MGQTVYVDVLLAVNFFINYFLILSTGRIMRNETKRVGACLAAVFGAISALSIFLPPMNSILNAIFKLTVSGIMVLIAFGRQPVRVFLKYFLVMCAVTFGFGGTMMALWLMAAPNGMYYYNGVTYFNISPEFIIIVTIACYSIITIAGRICTNRERREKKYHLSVTNGEKTVFLDLMCDTGNTLSEPFSGYPVIIVKRSAVEAVLPKGFDEFSFGQISGEYENTPTNCRVIPYNSVGGGGMLTAFLPESIKAELEGNRQKTLKCYIAVSESMSFEEYDGIVNPAALTE